MSSIPTPAFAPAGPRSRQPFAKHLLADVSPVGENLGQRASVAIRPRPAQIDRLSRQQARKGEGGAAGKHALGLAAPIRLRRIDPVEPDLFPSQPERVAVDDAGDALARPAQRQGGGMVRAMADGRDRQNGSDDRVSHRLLPRNPRTHLGTFQGEALRRAGSFSPPRETPARDLASAVAMVAFLASAVVVLAGVFSVGVPV